MARPRANRDARSAGALRLGQSLLLHAALLGAVWGAGPREREPHGGPERPARVALRLAARPAPGAAEPAPAPEEELWTVDAEPDLEPAPAEPEPEDLPDPRPEELAPSAPRFPTYSFRGPRDTAGEPDEPAEPSSESAAAAAPEPEPVAVDREGANLLHAPEPEYPSLSRRLGEEGAVLCLLHVAADGAVERVEVLRSSGHSRLDEAAVRGLLEWRLAPASAGGRPVPSTVRHRVVFRLEP